jgi:hypothetical protein
MSRVWCLPSELSFQEFAEDPSELNEFIALVSAYMRARNEIPLIGVTGDDSSAVHHYLPTRKTPLA